MSTARCAIPLLSLLLLANRKDPMRTQLKFKNADEAHAWTAFAAAVVESCESDEPDELPREVAELADKFILEEYRPRAKPSP